MHLNDSQLYEKILVLLSNNQLGEGGRAVRIAMQVVRYGLGSLSWQQRFIYLGQVVPLLRSMDSRNDAGGGLHGTSETTKPTSRRIEL